MSDKNSAVLDAIEKWLIKSERKNIISMEMSADI